MSINNFTQVVLEGSKLVVRAETLEDFGGVPAKVGPGTGVAVTVVLVADESRRCPLQPTHPELTPWSAESRDGEDHGFRDHDHVYVVGAITADGEEPFLWAKEFCVGAPPA